MQRLKLLEKKKTEMALKSRKEIADYIAANKPDRARIRVETIIREENTVEAMELLEMFCDLLVARMGLMKAQPTLDHSLEEAVTSLIWSTPRLDAEVQELKIIAEQLRHKYGREFFETATSNSKDKVNKKLMKKLGVEPPEKRLVEMYLVEIAKSYSVPFTPDPAAMEIPAAPLIIDGVVMPSDYGQNPQPMPPGFIQQPTPYQQPPAQPGQNSAASGGYQPHQPGGYQPQQPGAGSYQPEPSASAGYQPQPPTGNGGYQPQPPTSNVPGTNPSYNNYPGSASAPSVFMSMPPPYSASGEKQKFGDGGDEKAAWSDEKPPLPTDQVTNVYPNDSSSSNTGDMGLPTVPPQQPDQNTAGANSSHDDSFDDLERRFNDLRRKP